MKVSSVRLNGSWKSAECRKRCQGSFPTWKETPEVKSASLSRAKTHRNTNVVREKVGSETLTGALPRQEKAFLFSTFKGVSRSCFRDSPSLSGSCRGRRDEPQRNSFTRSEASLIIPEFKAVLQSTSSLSLSVSWLVGRAGVVGVAGGVARIVCYRSGGRAIKTRQRHIWIIKKKYF